MDNFKRYTSQVLATFALPAVLFNGSKLQVIAPEQKAAVSKHFEMPLVNTQELVKHAKELLPTAKRQKIVRALKGVQQREDIRPAILELVKKSTPKKYQHRVHEIVRTVIAEANHHKMDPMFLLAVIQTESHFNPTARGGHGEIGLMQILPSTARWIAPQAGIAPEKINLEDPTINIRLGATYFAMLRKKFEGTSHHYVAAYNMGSGNVRKLLRKNTQPEVYPTRVLGNYKSLYAKLFGSEEPAKKAVVAKTTQKKSSVKVARSNSRGNKAAGRQVASSDNTVDSNTKKR